MLNRLKNFEKFKNFNKVNESISAQNFETIPEGAKMPSSGVVKIGFDPTSDKLHLGHLIPLRMVKKLKENGMEVNVILGTFTAQMGDPSGKNAMRPILSFSDTKANADSIISQIHRVLGSDVKILYNHEWFNKMTLPEIMSILSKFTVDYLMSRDSFKKRKEDGNNIGMHELIVPLLQGLDSVELKAAVEVGGTDQRFNFLISRDIQSKMGQEPEICLMSPVINGTDGRKMSKSYNNCIYINDSPSDVFGKAMSVSDETMHEWYPLFIENHDRSQHPMILKKALAFEITKEIWDEEKAQLALSTFEKNVQSKAIPDDIPEMEIQPDFLDFIKNLVKSSRSDARRLVQSNAVSVNGEKVSTIDHKLNSGDVVKVGKRNFAKAI